MAKIRELALKLFAKVFGIKTATTYLVKKQFPKFRASLKDHWEFLIIKLLRIYREKQEQQRTQELPKLTYKQVMQLSKKEIEKYAKIYGIKEYQVRHKLIEVLELKQDKPELPKSYTLTSKRGRYLKEWDGKWA